MAIILIIQGACTARESGANVSLVHCGQSGLMECIPGPHPFVAELGLSSSACLARRLFVVCFSSSYPGGRSPGRKHTIAPKRPALYGHGAGRVRPAHKLVIRRTADPCLDWIIAFAITDMKIGRRLAAKQIMRNPDRMLGSGGDALVGIDAKAQGLLRPMAVQSISTATKGASSTSIIPLGRRSRKKRRLPRVSARLQTGRSSVCGDRAAFIQPDAIAFDDERQMPVIDALRVSIAWRLHCLGAHDNTLPASLLAAFWVAPGVTHNYTFPFRRCFHAVSI